MDVMNYLDLFHGIGGFALGAYWAGIKFENHYCSDIEPYCQELYAKRFPDSIQLGDITKIKTEDLPSGEWIITGGFPCQDISIAGRGAGITGSRSGLWFEYWRIIRDLQPRFAVMENVGALTFRGMDRVLGSLSEIGYDAEWQDIRASDMGAPHRRERIWIIAYPDTASDRRNGTRKVSEIKERLQQKSGNTWKLESGFKRLCEDVADTEGGKSGEQAEWKRRESFSGGSKEISNTDSTRLQAERPEQQTAGITGNDTQVSNATIKRLERQEPERWDGWEQGLSSKCSQWSTEPEVGRVANGIPARVDRLRGLGNAIVPQIAEILFRRIKYIQEDLCNC